MQQEARRYVPSDARRARTTFFDVVVTSLLGYEDWTPEHLPLESLARLVTQTPQVVLDLQFLASAEVLWLSFDAAPVLAVRWVEAVMKELEAHLASVIQQEMEGDALPADPRKSYEPFAPPTPFTRLDSELLRTAKEHGNRVAVATANGNGLEELTYNRQGWLLGCQMCLDAKYCM